MIREPQRSERVVFESVYTGVPWPFPTSAHTRRSGALDLASDGRPIRLAKGRILGFQRRLERRLGMGAERFHTGRFLRSTEASGGGRNAPSRSGCSHFLLLPGRSLALFSVLSNGL